jgi:RimJ/RimL family protein N-acetyltransferase
MIMSTTSQHTCLVRKLRTDEAPLLRDHLLRLDPEARRMRFAHAVSDAFIAQYAGSGILDLGSIVYGAFIEGELRGVAELRKLTDVWGREAEAAFSIEKSYQDDGLGTELMGRVIRSARNRGVQILFMSCLAENARMQAIARKYDAVLRFEYGEIFGEIVPETPNYFSMLAEAVEDRVGYLMAVLDLQQRLLRAA